MIGALRRRFVPMLFLVFLLLLSMPAALFPQGRGSIVGRILDASDSSPLWGVNVRIKNTATGASTNDQGRFTIPNVSAGKCTVIFTFLGYLPVERAAEVKPDGKTTIEVKLTPTVIEGAEVIVTAQLKGQQAAINQQVNSSSIINVVSADKIKELPDQNAAEAISRLPGISIQRDGGEGQKVLMRGLSPKYANVTVNGEKIPSTDAVDRSVDLSSVSTDMLAGIEVYKSYTADQDGDAVAGTINFAMKKAPETATADLKVQGGYNALEDTYNDHKISLSLSDRFFDNVLGVVVTGNHQRVNRASEGLNADYDRYFNIGSAILSSTQDIRYRYGASLAADAQLNSFGNFFLTGFWSKLDHNPQKNTKELNLATSRGAYRYSDGQTSTELLVLGLTGNHLLDLPAIGILTLDWSVSGSRSNQQTPLEFRARFYEKSIQGVTTNKGPDMLFETWVPKTNKEYLDQLRFSALGVIDKNMTYQASGKVNYNVGDLFAGYVKFGGKYNAKNRNRDNSEMFSGVFLYSSPVRKALPYIDTATYPVSVDKYVIGMRGFLSGNGTGGTFLDGRFASWPTLSGASLHRFLDTYRDYNKPTAGGSMFDVYLPAAQESYTAGEHVAGAYVMTEMKFGEALMILPGIRYERTQNEFKTVTGQVTTTPDEVPTLANAADTSGVTTQTIWLPTVQLRVRPVDWLTLRASASRTVARPNYFDLVPFEKIQSDGDLGPTITLGNPSLRYSRAQNYDAFVSVSNEYGYVSAGGFYKEISDVPYANMTRILDPNNPYIGWYISQTVNADGLSWVRGAELELQANLALLPSPFDGIVLNGNISFMKSRTVTPSLVTGKTPAGFDTIYTTLREGPMPGQSDRIANLAIGFEKWGFSGRLSLMMQGRIRTFVGTTADLDGYSNSYYRWDLATQQKIDWGLSLYFNIYNLTNARDKSFVGTEAMPTSELLYGRTAELGVRYKF